MSPSREQALRGVVVAQAATYGGMLANFGRNIALRLAEEGAELHFFASSEVVFGSLPPKEDLEACGGTFHGLRLPQEISPVRDLVCVLEMARALRELKVQVLHTRGSVMGFVGRAAAVFAHVPIVVHHQDDLYTRDTAHGAVKRLLFGFVECGLSLVCDRSFFVSEAVLRDAVAIGFAERKCVMVGHDLNAVFLRGARALGEGGRTRHRLFDRHGVPHARIVVGGVGRLAHLKGVDTFLQVASILCEESDDYVFVLKGDGPLRGTLLGRIHSMGLEQRVFVFTEEIAMEEMPTLYRSFDIFFLPTRREGFGMAFAEAMATGVPVVGSRVSPVTDVVGSVCGRLVASEDVAGYCDALRSLARNKQERLSMGSAARELALARWDGTRSAERVVEVYRDLLVEKGVPHPVPWPVQAPARERPGDGRPR